MTRAPVADLAPGERKVGGSLGHYLARVLRLHAGSTFVAFDVARGLEADALVVSANGDVLTLSLGPLRAGTSPSGVPITWIQGFAKADKCDAVVRDATELGATRIVVAATKRSIVKLDEARAEARTSRWSRIAEDAARQCGRSEVPIVERPTTWVEALAKVGEDAARFCLYENATQPLGAVLFETLGRGVPLAFACGPEGGLDEAEVAHAAASGWSVVSLGPLTLRTETVAAAVLGAVRIGSSVHALG